MIKMACIALVALTTASTQDGCDGNHESNTVKTRQAAEAERAAEQIRFTENAEIDNIKRRLELTSSPGLLGYIALINNVGQVALYTPVKGKVTSGNKRLTPTWTYTGKSRDCGQYNCEDIVEAPSDEGTSGKSGEYVFFWAPTGQYFQTNMSYVYSDQPFRPTSDPLLVLDGAAKNVTAQPSSVPTKK